MSAHALLAPSAASRWLPCPGSVDLDNVEGDDPSEYAAEGTAYHSVRADCLALGLNPGDFLGQTIEADGYRFLVDDEMVESLVPGIEAIRAQNPEHLLVEYRLDLRAWIPDGFGTLDAGYVVGGDTIEISDLKAGKGIPVSPLRNKQLMIYAIGYYDWLPEEVRARVKLVRLLIDQPRIVGAGGADELSIGELLDWGENILRPGALRALASSKLQASDEACRWCKKRPSCSENARFNLETVSMKFADMSLPVTTPPALPRTAEITPERRSYILRHRKMFEDFFDTLHAQAIEDALLGKPTPGMKLVAGRRGSRAWIAGEEEQITEALVALLPEGESPTETVLISPTAAESAIGKKKFSASPLKELVTQSAGKPVLADETDSRPALTNVVQKFIEMAEDDLLG